MQLDRTCTPIAGPRPQAHAGIDRRSPDTSCRTAPAPTDTSPTRSSTPCGPAPQPHLMGERIEMRVSQSDSGVRTPHLGRSPTKREPRTDPSDRLTAPRGWSGVPAVPGCLRVGLSGRAQARGLGEDLSPEPGRNPPHLGRPTAPGHHRRARPSRASGPAQPCSPRLVLRPWHSLVRHRCPAPGHESGGGARQLGVGARWRVVGRMACCSAPVVTEPAIDAPDNQLMHAGIYAADVGRGTQAPVGRRRHYCATDGTNSANGLLRNHVRNWRHNRGGPTSSTRPVRIAVR